MSPSRSARPQGSSAGENGHQPICNLNVALPTDVTPEPTEEEAAAAAVAAEAHRKHQFLRQAGYGKFDTFHRADLRISDIGNLLGDDWPEAARELGLDDADVDLIRAEYPDNSGQQAMVMLRLWINTVGNNRATGNELEKALRRVGREDIVRKCITELEVIEDREELEVARRSVLIRDADASDGEGLDEVDEVRAEAAMAMVEQQLEPEVVAKVTAASESEPPPPSYEESERREVVEEITVQRTSEDREAAQGQQISELWWFHLSPCRKRNLDGFASFGKSCVASASGAMRCSVLPGRGKRHLLGFANTV